MSQMQAVAAQAAINQEPVIRTHHVAITGDAIADLLAAIRVVCDASSLSARQIQYLFECYAKLYKDAADQNDVDAEQRRMFAQGMQSALHPGPLPYSISSSPNTCGDSAFFEAARSAIMGKVYQSGTHTPSTHTPDSAPSCPTGPGGFPQFPASGVDWAKLP